MPIIYTFFMFYNKFDERIMRLWQKFLVFWQQAGHVEIHIVLINTTNQIR